MCATPVQGREHLFELMISGIERSGHHLEVETIGKILAPCRARQRLQLELARLGPTRPSLHPPLFVTSIRVALLQSACTPVVVSVSSVTCRGVARPIFAASCRPLFSVCPLQVEGRRAGRLRTKGAVPAVLLALVGLVIMSLWRRMRCFDPKAKGILSNRDVGGQPSQASGSETSPDASVQSLPPSTFAKAGSMATDPSQVRRGPPF